MQQTNLKKEKNTFTIFGSFYFQFTMVTQLNITLAIKIIENAK